MGFGSRISSLAGAALSALRSDARSLRQMTRTGRRTVFQPFGDTRDNRYPPFFEFVRDQLGSDTRRPLLSFGCSTGEEVFTLRGYFPNASIKGLDVDGARVRACRRNLARRGGDADVVFEIADSTAREPYAAYDAIFAMSVFRNGMVAKNRPASCAPALDFAIFENAVADLARCLKPKGLLALRAANFRFADTAASAGFRRVWETPGAPPVYGRDNALRPNVFSDDGVFQKL